MCASNWQFSTRFKIFLLIVFLTSALGAELLKKNLLVNHPPFKIKRDIFNYRLSSQQLPPPSPSNEQPPQQEDYQQMLERTLLFTGVISLSNETLAIVQVENESFTVKTGDTIRGIYKIVKISENELTVNFNGQVYTIRRSGE